MKTKGLLLLFLACCCVSCECFQHVQGVVIDSETRLPIDNVVVKNTKIKKSDICSALHTDSLGHFDICPKAIGLFGCPKVSLSFEKEGYKKAIIKHKSCCTNNVEVILEKKEYFAQSCQPFVDSLNAMVARDQAIRMAPWNEENIQKMNVIDSTNTAHLKALIAQYGFPTWNLVGYAASGQAWLIAQHSDPDFLGDFLKSYRKAVKENNAEKSNLALMEDRHRMNEGLPQLYGSQLFGHNAFFPIANIDGVDERRQLMGLEPIKEYARRFNLDTIVVADFFLDYHSYYYLNLRNAFDAYWEGDYLKTIWSFGTLHYPFPKDLKLLCDACLATNDTLKAVAAARKMVLCGYRLEEDTLLDGFLLDSVAKEYEALVEEYRLQLDDKTNALFDSTQSFNEIKELLDAKQHPRYSIDAWNNIIPFIIQKHAEHVSESDYLKFFDWLYKQVIIGNYHLFDYAELYDEVYSRLFGKSYYGQKTFGKEVPLFEEEKVNERRKEIQLPPIEVWEGIKDKLSY